MATHSAYGKRKIAFTNSRRLLLTPHKELGGPSPSQANTMSVPTGSEHGIELEGLTRPLSARQAQKQVSQRETTLSLSLSLSLS